MHLLSNEKEVSFLYVLFNSERDLERSIASLIAHEDLSRSEILIWDNAPKPETALWIDCLRGKGVRVRYFASDENIGFGAGNNRLAAIASGKTLAIVNPDMFLTANVLPSLQSRLDSRTGIVSPRILYPNGSLQPNGGQFYTLYTYVLQSFRIGALLRRSGLGPIATALFCKFLPRSIAAQIPGAAYFSNFDTSNSTTQNEFREFDWVSGAFMLVSKSNYSSIGGFDEAFFLYEEDQDLCFRMRARGFRVGIVESVTVVHDVGFDTRNDSWDLSRPQLERLKSQIIFLAKHRGAMDASLLRTYSMMRCFVLMVTAFCRCRWSACKSHKEGLRVLNKMK